MYRSITQIFTLFFLTFYHPWKLLQLLQVNAAEYVNAEIVPSHLGPMTPWAANYTHKIW